jgi:RHS repeat-associated protein
MIGQRVTARRQLTWASLVIVGAMLGAAVARADDFGGQSSGGGNDPPPPNPPCNSCPCVGPGGSGFGGSGADGSDSGSSGFGGSGFGASGLGGSFGGSGPGNSNNPPPAHDGKPVSFFNGAEEMTSTDLVVNGVFPILIHRKYDSRSTYDSALGYGWSFIHERRLYEYPDDSVVVRHGCGTRDRYVLSGGAFVTPAGSMLATLSAEPDGSFRLRYLNGVADTFDSQGRLTVVTDTQGNRHEYSYDSRGKLPLVGSSKESLTPTQPMIVAYTYRLTRIDARGADGVLTGRYVTFGYDETTGRLTSVTADDGRSVTYEHDVTQSLTLGNLTQVNGLEGVVPTYGYADPLDPHNLTSITPAQGHTPIVNTYDDQDRVTRQMEGTRQMDIVYNVAYTKTTVTKTIRDHNGLNPYTAATVYDFDASGRVTKLTDALGNETRYTFNAAKMLTRAEVWQKDGATLSLLQAKNWTYDTNGNKLSEWVALDSGETITRSWTYEQNWIASEQFVSSAAPSKIFRTEYTFYFDTDGRPTNIQSEKRRKDDGSFQTTTYTYDSRNRLLAATLPDGVQQVNEYTGDYVTRTYFAVNGSAIPQLERRFEYDAEGNKIKQWDARGNLTQFAYDDRRRPISATDPLGAQTLHTYVHHLLTQVEVGRTAADGEGQVTKLVYDTRDRLIAVQRKNDAGVFVNHRTFQLDSEGLRTATTDAENRTASFNYDLLGRLKTVTDAAGKMTQMKYDAVGNRTSIIDTLNREVTHEFDDLNRLTAATQLGLTPSARTEYAFDAAGNVVSLRDAENHTTVYEYDALARNTRVTQPLGQYIQVAYDARDRLDFLINARGNKIDYGYDSWGGLIEEKQYPTASSTTPTRTIAYAHDNDGNVTSISDDAIQVTPTYTFSFDVIGRMYDETVKYLPGGDRVLQHRYDRYGNRSEVTLQDGAAVAHTYTYNKLNQLASANLAGAAISVGNFTNDDRQTVTLPNGVTASFVYRPNGPLESSTLTGPLGQIAQFAYSYDDVRNVDTHSDQYGSHDFNYDGANRLTQTLRPTGAGLPNEAYSYDRAGNREDTTNAALYQYDANNRLTQSPGLTYVFDADGNLASRSDGSVFTHDPRNRPTGYTKQTSSATYLYDANGRRIRKQVDGATVWYLWDGTSLLSEYDAAGTRTKRYAYLTGDQSPIQLQDANGTYYLHTDGLAPRLLTNSAAVVVWRARYDAFGQAIIEADPDGNGTAIVSNLRFPGQYFDAETGLHYNYFRSYDPALGRYIESDPIGYFGGSNVYAYGEGNPLIWIDPLGLGTCGTGTSDRFIPDNPMGFPFSKCCVEHDECYDGDCGQNPSKEECDRRFWWCLFKQCREVPFQRGGDCVLMAETYYRAVDWLGGGAFADARRPPPPPPPPGPIYGIGTTFSRLAPTRR